MKSTLRIVIHLCVIGMVLSSLAVAQVPIAVLDFEPKGVSAIEASALTDRFRDELFILGRQSGQYRVMERGRMEEILEEQNFQLSGLTECTTNECAVEVGKLIGVTQIIAGSISQVGKVYSVSARIISVETGEIMQVATYDYQGDIGTLMTQGMGEVVGKLIEIDYRETARTEEDRGILYLDSSPDSATVWVDGEQIEGTTPVLLEDQAVGERHVMAKKGSYAAETTLDLHPGELQRIQLDLAPTVGALRIVTTPADAETYLDQEYRGTSPLRLSEVPVGPHTLTVRKPGYDSLTTEVEIAGGTTEEVQVTLQKVPPPPVTQRPPMEGEAPAEVDFSSVRQKIQRLQTGQVFWTLLGLAGTATGGAFRVRAYQHYTEYHEATEEATALHEQIQREDTIAYAAFTLGAIGIIQVIRTQLKINHLKRTGRVSVSSSEDHLLVRVSIPF